MFKKNNQVYIYEKHYRTSTQICVQQSRARYYRGHGAQKTAGAVTSSRNSKGEGRIYKTICRNFKRSGTCQSKQQFD